MAMRNCAASRRIRKITLERQKASRCAFESEEEYLTFLQEYIKYVESHPIEVWKGGERPLEVVDAMTMTAFAVFIGVPSNYLSRMKGNDPDEGWEWLPEWIAETDRVFADQRIRGAVRGEYKENLVARLSGIGDKKEITGDMSLTTKPLDDVMAKLNKRLGEEGEIEIVRKEAPKPDA